MPSEPGDWEYSFAGSGPPLVLLHGLFGSSRSLGGPARALRERFRVISPSLRNHGHSPWLEGMDYPDQAGDVLAVMDRQQVWEANLTGHSLGGKVAMTLALLHPERCRRLVVLDAAPVTYQAASFEVLLEHLARLPLHKIRSRAHADQLLAPHIPDAQLRSYLLTNLVPPAAGNDARWRCNLAALHRGINEITGFPDRALEGRSYPGPTLFLHSPDSGYLRPEHLPRIREYFPAARCEAVPGAGHWLHVDCPREVLQQLQDFLQADS